MKGVLTGANLRRIAIVAAIVAAFAAGIFTEFSVDRKPAPATEPPELQDLREAAGDVVRELGSAAVRLPIAAVLGTVLALRPHRRGTTKRQPLVVQTQIVLAVVGALIMIVVGASLARAFGIVGVASLIRYRTKIDDPKDAVVMLSALAVGLACGVGQYAVAVFGTAFLVATLWVIESFEPETRAFELSVKLGDRTGELRPRIEAVLRRFVTGYELRAISEEEASYVVTAPREISTVRATEALTALVPNGKGAVEWVEKSKTK